MRTSALALTFSHFLPVVSQACAFLDDERVFSKISGGADCRQGHCVREQDFTGNTDQASNNLCGHSKEAAAFALLGLFAIVSAVWVTAAQRWLGRKESHGLATFWLLVACETPQRAILHAARRVRTQHTSMMHVCTDTVLCACALRDSWGTKPMNIID